MHFFIIQYIRFRFFTHYQFMGLNGSYNCLLHNKKYVMVLHAL